MGQVRNDTSEIRVLPAADYSGLRSGQMVEVPDDQVYHWVAGGFTPLTRYPVPYRLFANHQHDPLAYALPKPPDNDPSAIAVGQAEPEAPATAASQPAPQQPVPAATAPTAAPIDAVPAAVPGADTVKE